MLRLIGFIIGAAIGVLLVRYNILEGGEIQATRNAIDALGLKLWGEAAKLFAHSAGLKLLAGLAVGGVLGTVIQYLIGRQVQMSRR